MRKGEARPVSGPTSDVKGNPLAYLHALQKGKRVARREKHAGHMRELRRWGKQISTLTCVSSV